MVTGGKTRHTPGKAGRTPRGAFLWGGAAVGPDPAGDTAGVLSTDLPAGDTADCRGDSALPVPCPRSASQTRSHPGDSPIAQALVFAH